MIFHVQFLVVDIANTGFMIVRKSSWSASFFRQWWAMHSTPLARCDQHVLNLLLTQGIAPQSIVLLRYLLHIHILLTYTYTHTFTYHHTHAVHIS